MAHQYGKCLWTGTFSDLGEKKRNQIRYFKNNIDCEYTSIYNLHYYGTGAWRGEKKFNYLSISPTIEEVLENQAKAIGKTKEHSKKKKTHTEQVEREA